MNMASRGILFAVFAICIISKGNTSFVHVKCKDISVGRHGQQSLLECVVKTNEDVKEVTIKTVIWKKEGDDSPILFFHSKNTGLKPGYSFAEPSWNVRNTNVSLLIANTALQHEGNYTCYVMTDSGDGKSGISLKVTAKYNKPVIRYNSAAKNETLICESDGGYPKGQIGWVDWTKSSRMQAERTESGLFHLSSKLPLQSGSTFPSYTCIVFNASGGKEEETTFVFPTPEKYKELGGDPAKVYLATKIVAPVVVIGSLLVGLLLVLIFRGRFRGDHGRVPNCDVEEGNPQEMDETCS
ncbi:uncharacterized protein LOC121942072 isoform X2 [Plectropomus leopardus]|uniref:uncharacterized protein LOC121942072 isoform X2 n=1 Tax=Plectropomus leopardus TaxID=160734 RepID=UPI001C4DCA04|nr:uncharacterized protein LOC121942072 isoform X2 [Plectropomus leopardus]